MDKRFPKPSKLSSVDPGLGSVTFYLVLGLKRPGVSIETSLGDKIEWVKFQARIDDMVEGVGPKSVTAVGSDRRQDFVMGNDVVFMLVFDKPRRSRNLT